MGRLMHHDEQELLSVWEGWHWDDNKGGWLDPRLCAKARQEEVEYIRRHKMYTRVSRETCLRETGKFSTKRTRPELHALTPPLEALKVVLSEIVTGTRRGKVVALVDVRRAYFYAPARRRVFVELPPEDYQPGDEHMCGLLRYSLYGTRLHSAVQN